MTDMHLGHQSAVDARIEAFILARGEEPDIVKVSPQEYAALFFRDHVDRVPDCNGDLKDRAYRGIKLQVLTDQPVAA